jgi:transcriptional regulator with GAF, ATPase, and Fis domain
MNGEGFGNGNESFAAELSEAVNAIDFSNSLTEPILGAIDNLLQLASRSVGSAEASVLVREGNEGGLKFLTAIGPTKDKLLTVKVPPGKGIAGSVFSSGQPMAVNDVKEEGSFWSEADKITGFRTVTVLATPLAMGHETIGVLEFVNRPGEPPYPPFTPEEMDRAAHFAGTIGRLVDAYEFANLVESLFARSLKASIATEEGVGGGAKDAREWLSNVSSAPEHRDLLLLGVSLREIVSRGTAERDLCREMLEALLRFTESRAASTGYYGL